MTGGKAVMDEAVADSVAAHARAAADARGEQLSLLVIDRPLKVNGQLVDNAEMQRRIEERGAGRPKGAQNRTTQEWRAYVRACGPDPVAQAIRELGMTLSEFANYLSCKPIEAWNCRQRLREFVAPYLFARQAPVDEKGNIAPTYMQFNFGQHGPTDAEGKPKAPWLYLEAEPMPTEQNQALSAPQDPQPHNDEPHK